MSKVKKIIACAVFTFTLGLPQWSVADAIVVLKAEQALFATDKAVALGQQLSEKLKPQTKRFDNMGQQLQGLQQRLEADQDIMSSDELTTLKAEIEALNIEFQQLQQYLSNAKLQTEQEFLASMRPALDKVLRQLIEENNISLIINGQSVIYNTVEIDITDKVVELLNLEP
jgi:outer membrane protein